MFAYSEDNTTIINNLILLIPKDSIEASKKKIPIVTTKTLLRSTCLIIINTLRNIKSTKIQHFSYLF